MEITHLGHSSFKLRGKAVTVVTDPFDPDMVGLKFPKIEADIITVSHDHHDHNFIRIVSGNPIIIDGPGEYEVKGADIIGINSYHDEKEGSERGRNVVYLMKIDGISVVHLGDLGHKLDDRQRESLNGVDILLIPVGAIYTIDAATATQVISQLEPSIIIPMHYHTSSLNQQIFGKLTGVDVFLKEMGKEGITPQPKLNITKDKLPSETTVVVLE